MVSLIKSEILIMMGMGWPVSCDKWKALAQQFHCTIKLHFLLEKNVVLLRRN